MFDQTFVDTHAQAQKPWTLAASVTLQSSLLAAVLLAPILRPDALLLDALRPRSPMPAFLPVHLAPLAPAVKNAAAPNSRPAPQPFARIAAPRQIPRTVTLANDAPEITDPRISGPTTHAAGFEIESLAKLPPPVAQTHSQAPATPPVRETPRGPIAVGGVVQSALLTFSPRPVYPPLAKAARVQGTVRLNAIVGLDGSIRDLKLVSGPPLLVNAALDAVRRWRYRPTTLNGSVVEVITEIDVNFTLTQ